jgi:hypothetical protein
MVQKRIRALDTYTQLAPGDPGYIAPSDVFFAVDSNSFTGESKKQSVEDYMASVLHVEQDRLTGLSSRSVVVVFGSAFVSIPKGKEPDVYRISPYGSVYRRESVLWGFDDPNQPSKTGFALTIDADESLTGIVIEYFYSE